MFKDKNYIPILNLLRAIACLAVLLMHMHYLAGLSQFPYTGKIFSMGQQGVNIFFIISGFVIPYSMWNAGYQIKDFFRYILKRSIRIDPPYLLVILICLIAGLFTTKFAYDLWKILYHLLYLIPFSKYDWYQSVFWTLGIEFQFYLLIGLLLPFMQKVNPYILVLILVILSWTAYYTPTPDPRSYYILRSLHFFCIGLLLLLNNKNKVNDLVFHLALFSIVLFLVFRITLVTGITCYATALLIKYSNFKHPISNFFGKISYSLYITHFLVAEFVVYLLKGSIVAAYGLFLILIPITILIAYIFYLFIEKPSIAWSKKIKTHK
jgi:peptidoglycan/LPS O-acetylase OafA/YrhL